MLDVGLTPRGEQACHDAAARLQGYLDARVVKVAQLLGDPGTRRARHERRDDIDDLREAGDARALRLPQQRVDEPADKQRILSVVEQHDRYLQCREAWGFDEIIQYGRGILMLFYGKPGTGKTMTAHAIARHMNKRVLNVDIPTFMEHHDAERFLPGLFREARLQDAILFFDECEVLFGDRRAGNVLMTLLLTEIERFEGVAVLATNMPEDLDAALDRRILVKIRFPEPDRQARREIWRKHLPDKAPLAPDVDLDQLADRFEMTGGYIKNAVLAAVAAAVHAQQEQPASITQALKSWPRCATASSAPHGPRTAKIMCASGETRARRRSLTGPSSSASIAPQRFALASLGIKTPQHHSHTTYELKAQLITVEPEANLRSALARRQARAHARRPAPHTPPAAAY